MSGCPIHVDARQFVKQASQGQWDEALKTLAKTMPFPKILGRICDHPCESVCKRSEAGDAIAIGALERVCVENAAEKIKGVMLPRKALKVAVIGSGISSLTAAWDLLRKGYRVTLFEPEQRLGGDLWKYPGTLLPPDVIGEELSLLEQLDVTIRLSSDISGENFITGLAEEFAAVFIGLDSRGLNITALAQDENGRVRHDSLTMATSMAGVFAGGEGIRKGHPSPINDALDGRRAATSIDRYVMKVSMHNGRELEGPYPSRLHTNIADLVSLKRILPTNPVSGYSAEEATLEAGRCIQCECMECVKVCLYLDRNNGYPKKYARQVFNNEYVMHGRARTKTLFVNSCSDCGLCEVVCPNNFHVGDMMLQARRTMIRNNVMPPSFHEFALLDMEYSNGERCALSRHEPGKDTSAWLYFPSCQLCATSPAAIEASYVYLRQKLQGGVGIMLRCCGAPARWAGRDDLFLEASSVILSEWERLGKPRVITACSTCLALFQEQHPEMEAHTIWELLETHGLPEKSLTHDNTPISIIDPCMSRRDPETQMRIRRLAQSVGFFIRELPLSGEKAECCGFGGLMFNADPALARDVVKHRTTTIDPVDTTFFRQSVSENDYLAYCAMCRDNLAADGKRVSHLIEHLFPEVNGPDPATRGWISWTERRHNRARLKEKLVKEYGEQVNIDHEEHELITLSMSEEVRRTIDDRRILESEVRRVIAHAEKTGKRLYNARTGVFRSYLKYGNVTFWVEYLPAGGGFTVHNAYCHRMDIVGTKS